MTLPNESPTRTPDQNRPTLLLKFRPFQFYVIADDLDEERQLVEIAGVLQDALRAWSRKAAA